VTKQDTVASELCFQDTTAAHQASATVKHSANYLFSLFLTVSETSEIKGESSYEIDYPSYPILLTCKRLLFSNGDPHYIAASGLVSYCAFPDAPKAAV